MAACGLEVKKIAELLGIKPDAIYKVYGKICRKLNTKNITQAVFKASEAGFLKIDNLDFTLKFINKNNPLSKVNKETTVNKIDDLRNNIPPSYSNNKDFINDITLLPARSHHE